MTDTAPRPTLEAVAARAGVSRATVSRVVNGGDGVRGPLVERVRRAVEELGYVPNQAARSLVTRRHDAIAVVIAEPEARVFADPFFGRQLRGISKELTAQDNQLVLLLTEGRDDHARVARYLAGGHVDGALVFSLHLDDPLPALIQGAGVPMVIGGRPGWGGEWGEVAGVSEGVGAAWSGGVLEEGRSGGVSGAVRLGDGVGVVRPGGVPEAGRPGEGVGAGRLGDGAGMARLGGVFGAGRLGDGSEAGRPGDESEVARSGGESGAGRLGGVSEVGRPGEGVGEVRPGDGAEVGRSGAVSEVARAGFGVGVGRPGKGVDVVRGGSGAGVGRVDEVAGGARSGEMAEGRGELREAAAGEWRTAWSGGARRGGRAAGGGEWAGGAGSQRGAGYPVGGGLAGERDAYAGAVGGEREVGRRFGGGILYVDSDNRGGAQAAVRHLVGLGRTRVAHITGPLDQTSAVDRLDGYLDVMGDTDPALLAEGDFTSAGGEHAMRELLARRPDLDAVFAANDLTASGALRVLREQGRRVPEDVAVIGFDDMLPISEQTDPPLTTVRQDIEEMGRLMARLLLYRLARTPSTTEVPLRSVVLPTRLIHRSSA